MYSNALRIYLWMTYTVPYHAPLRPVHLSFVYVTVPYRAPPINCALIFVAKSDNNRVA